MGQREGFLGACQKHQSRWEDSDFFLRLGIVDDENDKLNPETWT